MSTNRKYKTYSVPQGVAGDGTPLCIQCNGPITAMRRRTFCSAECYENFRLRSNPGYARQKVFERDRGVCAQCGLDTIAGYARPVRCRNRARGTGHLWQADHIIPVVEGGGETGLVNFQTLCTGCHAAKTAVLNRKLAELRRLKRH